MQIQAIDPRRIGYGDEIVDTIESVAGRDEWRIYNGHYIDTLAMARRVARWAELGLEVRSVPDAA